MRKTASALLALSLVSVPSLASAQDGPAPTSSATAQSAIKAEPGQTVYDPAGGEVGKITSVEGDTFVIDTGTNTATLAAASLGSGAKGPFIAMTKAQLDAAVVAAKSGASAPQASAQ